MERYSVSADTFSILNLKNWKVVTQNEEDQVVEVRESLTPHGILCHRSGEEDSTDFGMVITMPN